MEPVSLTLIYIIGSIPPKVDASDGRGKVRARGQKVGGKTSRARVGRPDNFGKTSRVRARCGGGGSRDARRFRAAGRALALPDDIPVIPAAIGA